jgi:hypothetical protein
MRNGLFFHSVIFPLFLCSSIKKHKHGDYFTFSFFSENCTHDDINSFRETSEYKVVTN